MSAKKKSMTLNKRQESIRTRKDGGWVPDVNFKKYCSFYSRITSKEK